MFSDETQLPCGRKNCPLPELVLVHFPSYNGEAFYPHLPRTWVPIRCCTIQHKDRKSQSRTSLPLRLNWALTVHKAQGITSESGCVLDLESKSHRNAIALPGLAFVAFTRVKTFARLAFLKLPPLLDFFACRQQKEFQRREKFEEAAADMHAAYLLKQKGMQLEDEVQHHLRHAEEVKGAALTEEEKEVLSRALRCRGVTPLSEELRVWLAKFTGAKETASLVDLCRSFRGKRSAQTSEGLKSEASSKREPLNVGVHVIYPVLLEMGFSDPVARRAVNTCAGSMEEAINFCLAATAPDADVNQCGFSESINVAAERASLKQSFERTGLVEQTSEHYAQERTSRLAKRRASKYVMSILQPSSLIYDSYKLQADALRSTVVHDVFDFGFLADKSINACFWLSIVAGWSRYPRKNYNDATLQLLSDDLDCIREKPLSSMTCSFRAKYGEDALGRLAYIPYRCSIL